MIPLQKVKIQAIPPTIQLGSKGRHNYLPSPEVLDLIEAVLFDADGVLVDACELHFQAFNRALRALGWTITREEHESRFNGLPTQRKLEILSETKGFPTEWHKAVHTLKQDLTWDAIDDCLQRDPAKIALLEALKQAGVGVAVCSNSLARTLRKMLKTIGVADSVQVSIGNDEAARPKPHPDMYLEAAERLRVKIKNCAIVEDSPVGLQAAHAAKPGLVIQVAGPHEVDLKLLEKLLPMAIREAA